MWGGADRKKKYQKCPFVHNSVCSRFWESLFAIWAECSQFCLSVFSYQFKWKFSTSLFVRGEVKGYQNCGFFVNNKLVFPKVSLVTLVVLLFIPALSSKEFEQPKPSRVSE